MPGGNACARTLRRRHVPFPAAAALLPLAALLVACAAQPPATHLRRPGELVRVPASALAGLARGPQCDDARHYCLTKTDDGALVAFYTYDTEEKYRARGCTLQWEADRQFTAPSGAPGAGAFHSTCGGATFDGSGRTVFGPAPRDMDKFVVTSADGAYEVDTGQLICGEAQARAVEPCRFAAEPGVAP